MENKEKSFEDFGEYKKEENNKQLEPIIDEIKKVHGNTGKKKDYTPEQLANKSKKMKEAWARKKAV